MINKFNKEESQFIESFSKGNALPDKAFVTKLEKKILLELNKPATQKLWFFDLKFLVAGFLGVFAVAFISLGFFTPSNEVRPVTILSESTKTEIIQKVSQMTSTNVLEILDLGTFLGEANSIDQVSISDPNANFKRSIITYEPKNLFKICANSVLPKELSIIQLLEYKQDLNQATKVILDGKILKNTLLNKDKPLSYSVSYPISYIASNILFQEDFEVKQDIISKTNFVIQEDPINGFCDLINTSYAVSAPVSVAKSKDKIIKEIVLNKDFSIKEVNFYLNKISEELKLATMEVLITEDFISESEFNSIFK